MFHPSECVWFFYSRKLIKVIYLFVTLYECVIKNKDYALKMMMISCCELREVVSVVVRLEIKAFSKVHFMYQVPTKNEV